MKEELYR